MLPHEKEISDLTEWRSYPELCKIFNSHTKSESLKNFMKTKLQITDRDSDCEVDCGMFDDVQHNCRALRSGIIRNINNKIFVGKNFVLVKTENVSQLMSDLSNAGADVIDETIDIDFRQDQIALISFILKRFTEIGLLRKILERKVSIRTFPIKSVFGLKCYGCEEFYAPLFLKDGLCILCSDPDDMIIPILAKCINCNRYFPSKASAMITDVFELCDIRSKKSEAITSECTICRSGFVWSDRKLRDQTQICFGCQVPDRREIRISELVKIRAFERRIGIGMEDHSILFSNLMNIFANGLKCYLFYKNDFEYDISNPYRNKFGLGTIIDMNSTLQEIINIRKEETSNACQICGTFLVFNEVMTSACGNAGCQSSVCRKCLASWFGGVKPGYLVQPNRLYCMFCKRMPPKNFAGRIDTNLGKIIAISWRWPNFDEGGSFAVCKSCLSVVRCAKARPCEELIAAEEAASGLPVAPVASTSTEPSRVETDIADSGMVKQFTGSETERRAIVVEYIDLIKRWKQISDGETPTFGIERSAAGETELMLKARAIMTEEELMEANEAESGSGEMTEFLCKACVNKNGICPGCGAPFTKEAGCGAMYCPLCKTKFCFVCGLIGPVGERSTKLYGHITEKHGKLYSQEDTIRFRLDDRGIEIAGVEGEVIEDD